MAQEHLCHAFVSATCPASYTQGHYRETSYLQKVAHILQRCVASLPSTFIWAIILARKQNEVFTLGWGCCGCKERDEVPAGGAPHCPLAALEGQLSAPHACYLLLRRACRWKAVVGMTDTGLYLAFPKHSRSLYTVVLPLGWDVSASPPQPYLPKVSFRLPWCSFLVVNKSVSLIKIKRMSIKSIHIPNQEQHNPG